MGAYLTRPVTDKLSDDYKSEKFTCGSSSMQGWRSSQEDAHNCILELDKGISLFAVYDGHGGAEVAKYCSIHFPEFFKKNDHYQKGDIEKALIESFIEFDNLIKDPQVLLDLKAIASTEEQDDEGNDNAAGNLVKFYQHALSARLEAENVSEEETKALVQEAEMPLKEILAKYQSLPALETKAAHLTEEKPMSPMLHAKKNSMNKSDLVNGSDEGANETRFNGKVEENEVVSNSVNGSNEVVVDKPKKCEAESSEISSNSSDPNDCEPSSSSMDPPGNEASSSSQVSISRPRESLDSGNNEAEAKESNEASYPNTDEAGNASDEPSSSSGGSGNNNLSEPSSSNNKEEPTSNSLQSEPCSSNQEKRSSSSKQWTADLSSDSSEEEDDEYSNTDDSSAESAENESDDDEEDDDDDDEEEDEDRFCLMNQLKGNSKPGFDSGCTAVVAVVRDNTLFVANAGDSRCVVCRNGQAIEMSFDHKPDDVPEKQRIENAGGTVTSDGRVNGGLNLSRALGDHSYKQNKDLSPREQMITALPDIKSLELDPENDEFIVLACDGIWNFMASQDVINFVRAKMTNRDSDLSKICEELFTHCLAPTSEGDGTGCDNMTCIIIQPTKTKNNNKRPAEDVESSSSSETVKPEAKRIKIQDN